MKRAALVIAAVGAVGLAALVAIGGGSDGGGQRYWVELDNAFGLVEGGDVKVAGVRAGKVGRMELDEGTLRARIEIRIERGGFGSLRTDAFCESRPQSLIGEYFLDCRPGTSARKLADGGTIPVQQTASTVPIDLVNNIMRRPFRERFTILLNEFGAGLAARGGDLNAAIRRASPALRETDRVLSQLAGQRAIIKRLIRDADRVVGTLAANRGDVARWVQEARDLTGIQATEADSIQASLQRLPTFLRELQPTAALLGQAAREQTPVLRTLNANAGRLRLFFDALGPFADASRPAVRSLAEVAREGRPTVRSGTPVVQLLGKAVRPAPEVGRNLALVLEDLDDPSRATERDTRAPNGRGFTGLQALLRYLWAQSEVINIFDENSHLLKVAPIVDQLCSPWTDAEQAKDRKRDRCAALLGPSRPGINTPDPTATDDTPGKTPAPLVVDQPVAATAPSDAATDTTTLDYLLGP